MTAYPLGADALRGNVPKESEGMRIGRLLGQGATADVYDLGDNKALKLFHAGFSRKSVEKEWQNSVLIRDTGLRLANSYEVVSVGDQYGIVLDAICGPSLLDIALETRESKSLAGIMARIHKTFLEKELPQAESVKDILARNIRSTVFLSENAKRNYLAALEALPDGNALCHGDMHLGNILFANGEYTVIDYNNICKGHALFDIARTVYLTEMTPVPIDMPDRDELLSLKRQAADSYLSEIGVRREEIWPYMGVTLAARLAETGADPSGERKEIFRLLAESE